MRLDALMATRLTMTHYGHFLLVDTLTTSRRCIGATPTVFVALRRRPRRLVVLSAILAG